MTLLIERLLVNTFISPHFSRQHVKRWLFIVLMALLFTGCQTSMNKVADCKAGDWVGIGHRDGYAGLMQNFKERQVFCSAYQHGASKVDSAADYVTGWTQGNWDLWSEAGRSDGRHALPESQVETHVANLNKHHAPVNRPAYAAGWLMGNAEYWQDFGQQAGSAGKPLAAKETSRAEAATLNIRFDEVAYERGWKTGNTLYWQKMGFEDAHNGIPDSQLRTRTTTANVMGVLVQAEVYLAAWNAEIPNYWKKLGEVDAVSGKNFEMRSQEAKQKGLKIYEAEYRQSWEARLVLYWTQVGNDDGYGHPFQLEERMARATRDQVFVIARTRELYTNAWEVQNTRYCNVDEAFARGRRREFMAFEVCKPNVQGQVKRAYLSGQDYEMTAAKHSRAHAEVDEHARRVRDVRAKLEQINRDIRSHREDKKRVVNAETRREDKQHEDERHQLEEQLERAERQLAEARRREEMLEQQMLKLKRDIYLQ